MAENEEALVDAFPSPHSEESRLTLASNDLHLSSQERSRASRGGGSGRHGNKRTILGAAGSSTRSRAEKRLGENKGMTRIVGETSTEEVEDNERLVVGGADEGSFAVWTLSEYIQSLVFLKLCARWTVFNTPLVKVLQFEDIKTGPLSGCVLCVAEDGTIAVVAIDGFELLDVIPGSAFPLERVCIEQNNLLLVYADRRVIKTKELWRSMTGDKADEMHTQGGRFQWIVDETNATGPLSALATSARHLASTLNLNIARFITKSTTIANSIARDRKLHSPLAMRRRHVAKRLRIDSESDLEVPPAVFKAGSPSAAPDIRSDSEVDSADMESQPSAFLDQDKQADATDRLEDSGSSRLLDIEAISDCSAGSEAEEDTEVNMGSRSCDFGGDRKDTQSDYDSDWKETQSNNDSDLSSFVVSDGFVEYEATSSDGEELMYPEDEDL
ncbi:hypothetical protein V5O48_007539 [Marasmius crinis-equi]|uniref:Uncharacterized protein n=1 Tax=Marasmius crinis-equi TaxID=585013 RepID=A0ABR3FGF6_9AGAR